MGTRKRPRPNGTGGLWTIKRKRWNEAKQTYEIVELYVRGQEIKDPSFLEGKRKWVTGSGRTPEEAEKRLQRSLERHGYKKAIRNMGVFASKPTGRLLTEDYLLRWHSEISPRDVGAVMRSKYLQHLNNHIIPHIGRIPLDELSTKDLRVLFQQTLPDKRKVEKGLETSKPLLGSNALLNIYKTLNRALNVAVAEGVLERNPLTLVKAPRFEKPSENIPYYMHIIQGMFNRMKRENDPLHDYFYLALLGLRKGERLGLAWKNVSLKPDNPHIVITQQLQRITGIGITIKPSTKSGLERRISISGEFLEVLKRLKAQRKEQEKDPKFKPKTQFADLVFLTKTGRPIDPNTDNDLWRKTLDLHKVPVQIRHHAVRHVAATFLADLQVPEAVAKSILGHQSSALVSYYGRDTSKKNREAIEKYAEQLSNPRK
jgi:integrase